MMQSFMLCALVTVLWIVVGYCLVFSNGNAWIGDLSRVLLTAWRGWDEPFTLGAGTAEPGADDDPGERAS